MVQPSGELFGNIQTLSKDSVSVLGFGEDPNKVWFEAYEG